ncbi:hypothetical protein Gohar_024464 [Gossypium harknessii]|uniref:Uncharacterized protein n=1 Tax=Gossypium harknessii TaxID=34285 RepID=A0A7J9HG32_9ROSI|nr:hypothetical protein [Gossypium harknessii]
MDVASRSLDSAIRSSKRVTISITYLGKKGFLFRLKTREHPMQVPLYHVDFWVQIHDLLAGLMSKDLSVEALPKRAMVAKSCWLHDKGDAPWAVEMGSFLVRVI